MPVVKADTLGLCLCKMDVASGLCLRLRLRLWAVPLAKTVLDSVDVALGCGAVLDAEAGVLPLTGAGAELCPDWLKLRL